MAFLTMGDDYGVTHPCEKILATLYWSEFLRATLRQHICYSAYMLSSVCPSVTRVDHTKTVVVRIMKFSPYGIPVPVVFREQVSSRNSEGFPSPRAGALDEGGVGKIGDFRILSRHISETVQDRTKLLLITNRNV